MILALMVVYLGILHLVFNVFKWVQPTTRNRIYVTVVGLAGIYCILLVINVYQPMSTDLRVFRYVVPIAAEVPGRVVDVPIEANTAIKRGEVLFRIDPVPYQAAVDALDARLALARRRLEESTALAEQRAGSVFEVEAYTAEVKQLEAELRNARYRLERTEIRAPTDGRVGDIALQPGQVLGPGAAPVMTFVSDSYQLAATFRQEVINRIKPGDEAEVAFDTYPGMTLAARVRVVDRDTPAGQVVPSGRLLDTARAPHGFVFVQLDLADQENLTLAAGEAGAAAIYTDRGQSWAPVRKVFFRWYTWLNYVITEMDMRGIRQA